ncbi:hypothetical protein NJT12_00235 [Flavobacterium sp. AC]|uniref:Uncharacterized protein n=1 Tax=Flavobacterium azizsancarii TaxID=2961580 RepID=A0ABT4W611_9FLAO|nr:hypothetical protein [Flavobacterium azizsancarii]MDA6068030.1 hypothetical protein [Flavobacterium azizsancarii]
MDKHTKTKSNHNTEILNRIKEKYGFSLRFIRMSLAGNRKSEMSDMVKKDYEIMHNAVTKLLKTL